MRRIAVRVLLTVVVPCTLAILARPTLALTDRTIGVYFDAEGVQCNGTIVPGTPGIIYVLARLDAGAPGIHGFEFRFTGIPETWSIYPVPNPDMLVLGDPFGNGAGGGLMTCQRPATGIVKLYTVVVLASAEATNVRFDIKSQAIPSNPGFRCPLVINCDAPIYSMTCVEGVPCTVNPSQPRPCAYPTAIEPASWSTMKQFYR